MRGLEGILTISAHELDSKQASRSRLLAAQF